MIFLSNSIVPILLVIGSIVMFLGSFMLNKKTKLPKDVEAIDKCNTCFSESCVIKTSDIDKIKEELREQINNCEENNEKK